MTATPLETFIAQFVQALHQEQTPQTQAVSQLLQQISQPAAAAICDLIHTVEQFHPTGTPDLQLGDFFHSLFESCAPSETSSSQLGVLGVSDELHKAWDFHLT